MAPQHFTHLSSAYGNTTTLQLNDEIILFKPSIADGGGFEPSESLAELNGLANRPLQPLEQPSIKNSEGRTRTRIFPLGTLAAPKAAGIPVCLPQNIYLIL